MDKTVGVGDPVEFTVVDSVMGRRWIAGTVCHIDGSTISIAYNKGDGIERRAFLLGSIHWRRALK